MTPEEGRAWRSDTPVQIAHDEHGSRPLVVRPIGSEAVLQAAEDELVLEELGE
jgi:hypothetical protein